MKKYSKTIIPKVLALHSLEFHMLTTVSEHSLCVLAFNFLMCFMRPRNSAGREALSRVY